MRNDFPSGYARVIARGDEYEGQVGEVLAEYAEPSGIYVELKIGNEHVLFDRWEIRSCPSPFPGAK